MNDFSRRLNSIVVKNLPKEFTESQLEELFSKYGRIMSTKILPMNPAFEGGCGFVNFADAESSNKAVEHMNKYVIQGFKICVHHSMLRSGNNTFHRSRSVFNESNDRMSITNNMNPDECNGTLSPGTHNRSASAQTLSITPSKVMSTNSFQPMIDAMDTLTNGNTTEIKEHEPFMINNTYHIYLSNIEVPNVVFAATLEDYVHATLLITEMNKHEKLAKVQGNSYSAKLFKGQICAAVYNGDWYRARILDIGEGRVRVQYIDWGNTGFCDPVLEIRPLPIEYYKDPALCVKCILDGVPSNEKISNEQSKAIVNILVLDLRLEMNVLRIENDIPHVQLNLSERNLNNEIRAIFPNLRKQNQLITFDSHKPNINSSDIHYVQLTTIDSLSECFYVLLMRDSLVTIMNVLKDWNSSKLPIIGSPKANMLVCAQYEADDLWYRAWIKNVTENGFRVYFVDFGNDEIVSIDRLSECPDNLRNIPWLGVKVKLENIRLNDDERYILLSDFETNRLDMTIIRKEEEEDVYCVDLVSEGKSLVDHVLELRKKQPTKIINEVPKVKPIENIVPISNENSHSISVPIPTAVDASLINTVNNTTKMLLDTISKQVPTKEEKTDNSLNENVLTLITEQRRQNRLLEQVIAAINTTNALLTQLVQRY